MQKYKLSIADLDINVSTTEAPDMVHTLEGMVDRRIREIVSKSPRCSKSEAAILCALDYCADSIKGETKTRDMEHEYVRMSRSLEELKKEYEAMSAELEKLRRENAVMSDILSKAAAPATDTAQTPAEEPAAAKAEGIGEQIALDLPTPDTESTESSATEDVTPPAATEVMFEGEHTEESAKPAKKTTRRSGRSKVTATSKSKVGDMFDMLTFKDV
ncbi:MAG: cell division protein ZapA [Clostridia bacterium]|nr:cell division protein ZapA [Clostridia bacterium]